MAGIYISIRLTPLQYSYHIRKALKWETKIDQLSFDYGSAKYGKQ